MHDMRLLCFLFLLKVALCTHSYAGMNKIAIAVQGSADKLMQWIVMYNTFDHTKKAILQDLNVHAVLFVISNDKHLPVDKCNNIPGVVCLFANDANWVQMRNRQILSIYNYEITHSIELKYWLFSDDSMLPIVCYAHHLEIQPQQSINCLSRFIHLLLTRSSYPVVTGSTMYSKADNIITDMYCGSHMFVAYHRAAVHILLPYVDYDGKGNMALDSQGVVNMFTNRCFNGYSVSSGMLGFPEDTYKNMTFRAELTRSYRREKALNALYPYVNREYLTFNKEAFKEMCLKPKNTMYIDADNANTTANWRNVASYHLCSKALKPQFLNYVSTGHIAKVIGYQSVSSTKTISKVVSMNN